MGLTWDYNTLIYCVHLSMNCIRAMHSIMSPAPDPVVKIVTAALLQRGWLPSLPGARPAIPCMHHWPWKGVWLPVCLLIIYTERFDQVQTIVCYSELRGCPLLGGSYVMYYVYGKFNWFHSDCPLHSGWPLLGGSVMRSSTVHVN